MNNLGSLAFSGLANLPGGHELALSLSKALLLESNSQIFKIKLGIEIWTCSLCTI